MTNRERVTGVSDSRYNLASVLHYALQGDWTYAESMEDARGRATRNPPISSARYSGSTPSEPREPKNYRTEGRHGYQASASARGGTRS